MLACFLSPQEMMTYDMTNAVLAYVLCCVGAMPRNTIFTILFCVMIIDKHIPNFIKCLTKLISYQIIMK